MSVLSGTDIREWEKQNPYPNDWDGTVAVALETVGDAIRVFFESQEIARQQEIERQQRMTKPVATNKQSDYSDSGSEQDSDNDEQLVPETAAPVVQTAAEQERGLLYFLNCLPRCLPAFCYGFHLENLTKARRCYCPCDHDLKTENSTIAGRWRNLCALNGIMESLSTKTCNRAKAEFQRLPQGLLDHLTYLTGQGCLLHKYADMFVREVFKNYYGQGRPHLSFMRQ